LRAPHPRRGAGLAQQGRPGAAHGGRLRHQHGDDGARLVTEPARPARAVASRPADTVPPGLPGLDPRYSHVLTDARGASWHYLDNGPELAARGLEPVGTVLAVHGNPTWSYLWRALLT